jgi:RNA 2',3'-cyclic 3'-phosphodiesterase
MQHFFAHLAGQSKPPALMVRRFRQRQAALADRATDRLFLAVVPDTATAGRIAETVRHLRISHGLAGKPLRPEHLHVTLHHIADAQSAPPAGLIEILKERVGAVPMPPFRVAFDRAESFRNGALVLRGDDGTIGLDILQQRLDDALDGQPRKARPFTPHITLLRDNYRVPVQHIGPIEWTVREVVLVHSLLGRTTHRHLARWSLTG